MVAPILLIFWQKVDYFFAKKISQIGATRCQIFGLKCTKFDFRWGSAPDPAGGAYSAPSDPLAVFKGAYFYGKGRDRGEGMGKEEREGREGEREEGRECQPPNSHSGYATGSLALYFTSLKTMVTCIRQRCAVVNRLRNAPATESATDIEASPIPIQCLAKMG